MCSATSFPDEKKMSVIFRMEPGSLGPDGGQYIKEFCDFAQTQLQACAAYYINFFIEPRFDKTLAEMSFILANKSLNQQQVEKYLDLFGEEYSHFEDQLESNLEAIIDQFFGR
ncbi:hypothetical protein DS885_04175 [Psychromonas sp. B3M02]|uniref:hypothetical protein n=1 Tax=unclassified Psychromonas TaxID=2614957 RepID=UPI000DEAF25D|nr:hypothetical protein [Psychromonas sp. B3M02]RBW47260.1 hypothetical protein DS885_04175 [Psychromonas sp. B3M02]